MSDDKLEALRLIALGIPKTAMGEIGKAFAFDDDRSEARRILQSAGAASGGNRLGRHRAQQESLRELCPLANWRAERWHHGEGAL